MLKSTFLASAFIAVSSFLSGCMLMHAGMGHGSDHSAHSPNKTIIKEIEKDDLSISLEVPVAVASKEALIRVTIADAKTKEPKSGARVGIKISSVEGHAGHSESDRPQPQTLTVPETDVKGVYSLAYRFGEPGRFSVTASVVLDEMKAESAVSIIQDVSANPESSKKRSTTLMVLGGIGMGVMMALMFL